MVTRLPILTFHAIDNLSSVISVSPEVFQRGMARLFKRGFRTLDLMEALDLLGRGGPFPDRSFLITFDDGYKSVYEEAFPVLQSYGMSATVFVTTGERGSITREGRLPSLNERSMLNWQEIREMHGQGMGFGAHTLTHSDLTRLSVSRVEAEICESKIILEDTMGAPVTSFAYPFGRYNRKSRSIVQQHFACAFSDKLGFVTGKSDFFALERIDAYYLGTDGLFNLMLTRLFPWYISARAVPRQIRRALLSRLR